jgi:hypothetical protein
MDGFLAPFLRPQVAANGCQAPMCVNTDLLPIRLIERVAFEHDDSSEVPTGGTVHPSAPDDRGHAGASGSMPSRSFTAHRSFCLHPRYRSAAAQVNPVAENDRAVERETRL